MKNIIAYFILFNLIVVSAWGQENKITDKEWSQLIQYLETENHKASMLLSDKLLKKFEGTEDTSYQAANLRYMYLYSISGLLAKKELTKEEGEAKLKPLLNKIFVTPARNFSQKGMFNTFFWKETKIADSIPQKDSLATPKSSVRDGNYRRHEADFIVKNGKTYLKSRKSLDEKSFYYKEIAFFESTLFSCISNQTATAIYSFDTFEFAEPLDVETFAALHNDLNGKSVRIAAILLEVTTGGFSMPRFNLRWKLQNIVGDE